jgi:hypothetical protein
MKIHVLIITTIQFHAPQTVPIIMVTQLLVKFSAMMLIKNQHSVHFNLLKHGNSSATNMEHAFIHQIQFGVNSTKPTKLSPHF